MWTVDTWDNSVLGIIRAKDDEKLVALFNFSDTERTAWIKEDDGMYTDLISAKKLPAIDVKLPGYGVYWLLKN